LAGVMAKVQSCGKHVVVGFAASEAESAIVGLF